MPQPGAKVVADLRELRALAHPTRSTLLNELSSRGEATVSELANAIDQPVNRVSFHLRQLAKYGFIEGADHRSRDGRDRWWRLAYEDGVDWDQLAASSPTARQTVHSELARRLDDTLAHIRSYFSGSSGELPELERGAFMHDWYLQLSASEAEEFDQEYLELCTRWREKTQTRPRSRASGARKRFGIYIYGFPIEDDE